MVCAKCWCHTAPACHWSLPHCEACHWSAGARAGPGIKPGISRAHLSGKTRTKTLQGFTTLLLRLFMEEDEGVVICLVIISDAIHLSGVFCPLKQLFSVEVCKSLFGNLRNGVVYFPSLNANADIKNFRHLLLDLRGSAWARLRLWLRCPR